MSSKLVVQVEPERLELRLRGASALAAGTVYAPVVLEGAGGAVAPVLRLFRDETCADAVAWTSEPASPVPHHSRLMSFPELRLDVQAALDWFADACDAKSLPSSGRVWGWLVAVDMGNGSDVGPVVLGASRVPVLLHDFSPVETEPGDSWSSVLAELVAEAIANVPEDATLGGRISALEENTYTKAEVDAVVAALKRGSRQIVASLSDVASPQPLVIYMVAKSAAQTNNVYDEYIWMEVGGAGRWEKIGDTEIDLSGYVRKEAGKGLSTNDYTAADKTKLAGIAAGAQVNVIETVKVNGTALTPSGKAVDMPIPSTTQTLAQEEYDSTGNSVTVDTPSQRDVKLKIRNVLSSTVNTLDTSASGTIATREWVQQEINVPSPSDADPAANGTAWEGESDNYSRADHVHPTDTSRQASITASGILKGNGSGGVTAAVAGTDYQSPLTIDATPTANSTNPVQSGGVKTALDGRLSTAGETRTVTATDSGGAETYKFAGTGDTDANTVVRVKNLPYINEGEAEEMLVDVYAISSRGVQRHTAASGETSATFGFADTPGTDKIADAILDIDNSGNSSDFALEFYGLGTDFALAVPDGEDLAEMTSVDGGARARFYFTETALVSNNLPVISIQRITLGAVATAITRGS